MRTFVLSRYLRRVRILLLLLWTVLATTGCVKDLSVEGDSGTGEAVAINLSLPGMTFSAAKAGGAAGRAVTDDEIGRVRVIVINQNNGRVALNQFFDNPNAPFWFHLPASSYDFYFVINEPLIPGEELTGSTALGKISFYDDLARFAVASNQLVDADGYYVMLGSQTNVKVEANYLRPTADGHYEAMVSYHDGTNQHNRVDELAIVAKRLAVKVNLKLVEKATGDIVSDADPVSITGLPTTVPLLEGVLSAATTTHKVALTPTQNLTDANGANLYDGYQAIIPSYLFRPSTDKAKAAVLNVELIDELGNVRTMALGHQLPNPNDAAVVPNYQLYRNTFYRITGNLTSGLELDISVLDWDEHELDMPVGIASTEIGQAGCENNLSANGETFNVTFFHPDLHKPLTEARIRYDVADYKDNIVSITIPAPTYASGHKSTVSVTTPGLTKYADNQPIVMEVKVNGVWKTVQRGTLWPPEFSVPAGYKAVTKSALIWSRKEMTGVSHATGTVASSCSNYYTVHPNHPKSGKGKWLVPDFRWAESGDMYPIYEFGRAGTSLGGNPIYGDALQGVEYYNTNANQSVAGKHLVIYPNAPKNSWNEDVVINPEDGTWCIVHILDTKVTRLRCNRRP